MGRGKGDDDIIVPVVVLNPDRHGVEGWNLECGHGERAFGKPVIFLEGAQEGRGRAGVPAKMDTTENVTDIIIPAVIEIDPRPRSVDVWDDELPADGFCVPHSAASGNAIDAEVVQPLWVARGRVACSLIEKVAELRMLVRG
jgi:hypothetical protein